MKRKLFGLIMIIVLLLSVSSTVFAAGPAEYTIDVRNRTGAPVELNYRGADGIIRWTTVPEGVSSLTLTEGVYAYWADPKCGHIAGTMNLSQQRQILWISCDDAVPMVQMVKFERSNKAGGGTSPLCYGTAYVSNEEGGYLKFMLLFPCGQSPADYASFLNWALPSLNWNDPTEMDYDTFQNQTCSDAYDFNEDLTSLWNSPYSNDPLPACRWLY